MSHIHLRRRDLLASPLLVSACGGPAAKAEGWPKAWDRLLIERAVRQNDQLFDERIGMVTKLLGPTYQYHTRLRDMRAHPTRESLEYALWLLEAGGEMQAERAFRVLRVVLSLQDRDPQSKWYGIWGWYQEEPPSRMQPADWNWADFNGATILLILFRHAARLPAGLRATAEEALVHAAASIRRRNVSMSYTNIAVKGTFVTAAAAEWLKDQELLGYAQDRMRRLCAEIDRTGSFAEYNSPTYLRVSLANLTRIRMHVRDEQVRNGAARIEHRLWMHLARHWDSARKQVAGPMSRCYQTDLGTPLWLEKALGGRLGLATLDNRSTDRGEGSGETAVHDYRVPEDLRPIFFAPPTGKMHRELFILPSNPKVRPVQGATYIAADYSLGTVNRGDFWVQRRPLLVYFGDAARPARSVTLRLVKDSYDFSSALFYSTQKNGCVLAAAGFRNPGGDKHISLDPIQNGAFSCSRLFLELDLEGLDTAFKHRLDGNQLLVDNGAFKLWFALRGGRFGRHEPRIRATTSSQSLVLTVDLLPERGTQTVRWADVGEAWLAFTLACGGAGESAEAFRQGCSAGAFSLGGEGAELRLRWASPAGALELASSRRVAKVEDLELAFDERMDNEPVPPFRLSEEKLSGGSDEDRP